MLRAFMLTGVLLLPPTAGSAVGHVRTGASYNASLSMPAAAVRARRQGTVTGRVTEAAAGAPVVGALVSVVGTQINAITDAQGRYLLSAVPVGRRTISVRRIGYNEASTPVTVSEGATAVADIALNTQAVQLSEVVVTATGEQRKVALGNVVATVAVDSIVAVAPITNVTDMLAGRVPGLLTFSNSGITGSAPRIRLRGFNSLSQSNAPLMIIDGVRVENSTGGGGALGAGTQYGWTAGAVTELNPDEIESVDIVKGPSAATLYGTDAANGVILIKTKRGQPGRTQFTIYTEGGVINQPSRWNDTYYAFGHTPTGGQTRCSNLLRIAGGCALDSLSVWSPMRDAPSSPVGTGNRQQLGLQAAGGVNQFRYFFSSELENETGYLKLSDSEIERLRLQRGGAEIPQEQIRPNYLKRASLRGNISTHLGSNADLAINTALAFQKSQLPNASVFQNGAWGPGYNDTFEGWQNGLRPGELFAVRSAENLARLTTGLSANWNPAPWLTTRGTVGIDFSSNFSDNLQRRDEGGTPVSPSLGRRTEIRTSTVLYTVDLGSSASFTLAPNITSRTSIGAQYNRRNVGSVAATGTNLPPGSSTLAGAATLSNAESTVQSVVAGGYGEQMFGFHDRFFVTAALRADGASSFGRNFKTAYYPKASASWVISDQSFFPKTDLLSSLRLRLAYGSSGVQPAAVAALPALQFVTVYVNGATATGAQLQALGNANLKPERVNEFEGGFDADMFHQRLQLQATAYYRKSSDALVQRSMPRSIGITGTGQLDNVGSVRNQGFEGDIKSTIIDGRKIGFTLDVNGSVNSNKLLKLDPTLRPPEDRFVKFVAGYPLFGQWDRRVLSYKDANNDGVLTQDEVVVGDSIEFLGNTNPTRLLNVTPTITLFQNHVQISSLIIYRGGWIQTNFTELNKCNIGGCRARNDPKAPLREQAAYIAFTKPGLTYAGYEEDGTYTRWSEASISYRVHDQLLQKVGLGVHKATLTLSARNLHLWTKYSGLDPEVTNNPSLNGNFGTVWDLGYDNPVSPPSRYVILRMTIGF